MRAANTQQRRQAWINRNAPCLAVCALCDDATTPTHKTTSTRDAAPQQPRQRLPCAHLAEQVRARARAPDPTTMHNVVGPVAGSAPVEEGSDAARSVPEHHQSRDAQGAYGGEAAEGGVLVPDAAMRTAASASASIDSAPQAAAPSCTSLAAPASSGTYREGKVSAAPDESRSPASAIETQTNDPAEPSSPASSNHKDSDHL